MQKIFDYLLLDRETYELAHLNEIWGAFNDKKITPKECRRKIYSFKWKYHHDKIDLLMMFAKETL